MDGHAPVDRLQALDGFEGRALGIDGGSGQRHRLTDRASGVNAGSAGFVGKADVVGIGKPVKEIQIGKGFSLAIGQLDNRP